MKIQQLIEELRKLDPDMVVYNWEHMFWMKPGVIGKTEYGNLIQPQRKT